MYFTELLAEEKCVPNKGELVMGEFTIWTHIPVNYTCNSVTGEACDIVLTTGSGHKFLKRLPFLFHCLSQLPSCGDGSIEPTSVYNPKNKSHVLRMMN